VTNHRSDLEQRLVSELARRADATPRAADRPSWPPGLREIGSDGASPRATPRARARLAMTAITVAAVTVAVIAAVAISNDSSSVVDSPPASGGTWLHPAGEELELVRGPVASTYGAFPQDPIEPASLHGFTIEGIGAITVWRAAVVEDSQVGLMSCYMRGSLGGPACGTLSIGGLGEPNGDPPWKLHALVPDAAEYITFTYLGVARWQRVVDGFAVYPTDEPGDPSTQFLDADGTPVGASQRSWPLAELPSSALSGDRGEELERYFREVLVLCLDDGGADPNTGAVEAGTDPLDLWDRCLAEAIAGWRDQALLPPGMGSDVGTGTPTASSQAWAERADAAARTAGWVITLVETASRTTVDGATVEWAYFDDGDRRLFAETGDADLLDAMADAPLTTVESTDSFTILAWPEGASASTVAIVRPEGTVVVRSEAVSPDGDPRSLDDVTRLARAIAVDPG
jgi:hypothetical protein